MTQEPMTAEQLIQKTAIDISHAFENKQDEPEAAAIEVFQILTERFNQAREADKLNADKWVKFCELMENYPQNQPEHLKMDIDAHADLLRAFNEKAETKIQELESKVLELTDALEFAKIHHDPKCKNKYCLWLSPSIVEFLAKHTETIDKALSTTPTNAIRERIKAEGFNEGVEAAFKAVVEAAHINPEVNEDGLYASGVLAGKIWAERNCQKAIKSIKKEGKP